MSDETGQLLVTKVFERDQESSLDIRVIKQLYVKHTHTHTDTHTHPHTQTHTHTHYWYNNREQTAQLLHIISRLDFSKCNMCWFVVLPPRAQGIHCGLLLCTVICAMQCHHFRNTYFNPQTKQRRNILLR
jgi:hypothetical protein